MTPELEPAFVLHTRAYRETSLIVECFTAGSGRLGLVARGARRPKSALRGTLQPFAGLLIGWSGRGEMGTLRTAETAGVAPVLAGDALFAGLYLNELMMRLTHRHDPHPELFDAYDEAIRGLATAPIEPVLRIFEKHLLQEVGYGPLLDRCADTGEPIREDRGYRYISGHGPVERGPEPMTQAVEVAGRTLLALEREEITDPETGRDAKRLMRHLIRPLLGDRPLSARALFAARKA